MTYLEDSRGRTAARAAAGLVALGLGLAAAGCSSSGSTSGAAKDATVTGCTRDAASHQAIATGVVHNNSSKRSNYVIQLDVMANDSKIESGFASVLQVDPGQRRTFTVHALGADVPSGTTLTCIVTHVGRLAAP